MQDELATGGARIGGHDRHFDAKLVGGAGLAFADALSLGRMEGIELPAALTLLLGADLIGLGQRPFEYGLEVGLASSAPGAPPPRNPRALPPRPSPSRLARRRISRTDMSSSTSSRLLLFY